MKEEREMSDMAQLGQEFGQYVIQLTAQLLLSNQSSRSLSEMERGIREMQLQLGQFLLSSWLAMQDSTYPADSIPCSRGGQADYQFRRERVLKTVVGRITYTRSYYVRANCHTGQYPLDAVPARYGRRI